MSPSPDIAILLPDLRGGGVERMRLHLAQAFMARGLSVELVLLEAKGDLLSHVPAGLSVVDLHAPRLRQSLLPLTRYLWRRRPQALLAALWPLTSIAILATQAAPGTRVVVSDHNTLSLTPLGRTRRGRLQMQASIRLFYPLAHGVITPSAGVKRDLEALGGWRASPIEVVPNPVFRDHQPPPAALAADDPWAEAGDPKIIAIGSLKEQKDYPTLLEAFARLVKERPARLLILGQGSLRASLEEKARALGLGDRVRFGGFVPDPRPYLLASELFVLSSAWEGFGNVIVEALGQGVPVVSTDCPSGPREILDDGRFGALVPVRNPEALARAMRDTLAATHDRSALIARARTFSVERAAERYLWQLISGEPDRHFERASR